MTRVSARCEGETLVAESAALSAVSIRTLDPGKAREWDGFVLQNPRATFFHQLAWKCVVERTFGYEPHYVYSERQGRLTGILPLFYCSNWLTGKCLFSTPMAVYGGICAADEESEKALLQYAKQLAADRGVQFLELRNPQGGIHPGFVPRTLYVTFGTELSADPQANLKRLPRDTRYMIRKAEKSGLSVRRGLDQMPQFYGLFASSMHRLGTPVYPRHFFEHLLSELAPSMDLLLVYAEGRPVSGVLSFLFRDAILPYYAGAVPEANRLAANNFMYWELMKIASQAGMRWFDFGRSKRNTGSYAFKSQWGMRMDPLPYEVYLVKRKDSPNFSPVNPKFALSARLWSRLPLWATMKMGPHIVRWFP